MTKNMGCAQNPVQPIACSRIPSLCRKDGISTMPEFVRRQREVKSVLNWTDDRGVPIREFASVRCPINDVVHQAGNSGLAAVFIPELTPNEADVPKIGLNP